MNEKERNKINTRIEEIEIFFDNNRDFLKFDSHALLMERGELHFKRNNSKEEMLGFVIGFNEAKGIK